MNAKYALRPIPGAKANGKLAQRPITVQPIKAAIAVANKTSSKGIPVPLNMAGFTNRIYAIVMKVVNPALISLCHVTPASVNPNLSSIIFSNSLIISPKSKYTGESGLT